MGKKSKYDLKNMSLQEILNKTNAIFNPTDILNFCDDPDVIEAFVILYDTDFSKVEDLLVKNEDKIDKEKLVFNIYLNYVENIKLIEMKMKSLIQDISGDLKSNPQILKIIGGKLNIESIKEFKKFLISKKEALMLALQVSNDKELFHRITEEFEELSKFEEENRIEEECKRNCKSLLKDTDVYIEKTQLDNGDHINMTIYSSREEIEGKTKSSKKEIERLKKMDQYLGKDGKGLGLMLQSLILTDLEQIMPEKEFGMKLREIILVNALLKAKMTDINELNDLKDDNYEAYEELLRTAPREDYLEELRSEILKNARHIDIDKMILICIYRYEEYIENSTDFKQENYNDFRDMVYYIMSNIKNNKTSFSGRMLGIDTEEKNVEYTYDDAEKFMIRLTEKEYVKKEQILQYREDLLSGKINISDINRGVLQLLDLSNEEYDKVINLSDENAISIIEIANINEEEIFSILNDKKSISKELFLYVIENGKISMKSALDLYYNGKVGKEYFADLVYDDKFIDLIDIKDINKEYIDLKSKKKINEEDSKRLDKKLELYKFIYIDNKEEKEQEEAYNDVMYNIAETFEDENDVLYYYKHGLISIEIVAEWCSESTIERLYNETKNKKEKEELKGKIIDLSEQGKISKKLVEQILLVDNITYDELMTLILQHAISESKIVDLYMQGKIFDADFEEMLNNGIISHEEFFTATELRTQEKLEETSAIKLSPVLKNIPDKKDIIFNTDDDTDRDDDWFKPDNGASKKTLIHPGVRYEFLKALGAKKADVIDIDEDNAFYNYEFFVIPNKDGEFDLNSVVIAERFYKDKDIGEEGGYALDNATYFFQYKDLMVNSNLSKQEMTKERDKIVFRANHRSGSWAISVLQKVAQTMLSTKFADCTTEKEKDERAEMVLYQLDKILIPKQIKKVLDLAGEIDDEEKYTYDVISGSYGSRKSNDTNDDNDEMIK